MPPAAITPRAVHLSRLRSIWRSAGWPCHDAIELDLVAAAWVGIERDAQGRETLHLTTTGLALLADARHKRSRSASAHDRLAARVSAHLAAQGRIVWRELWLRAKVSLPGEPAMSPSPACTLDLELAHLPPDTAASPTAAAASAWRTARPDVFSIRNTSVERYLDPRVHEIKASRADLLCDLRNPAKRAAYRWLSCETYYVFPAGLAAPEEIPPEFGILTVHGAVDDAPLELVRAAQHAPCTLPFAVWMALARSTPVHDDTEPAQQALAAAGADERT